MNNKNRVLKESPAVGHDALEFIDSLLTPEEIAESDLRVSLIGELSRQGKNRESVRKNLKSSAASSSR